jgi:hypothetical protein
VYKSSQPCNFLCIQTFATFSTDSKSASNFAFFEIHIENIWGKYFLGHISPFANFYAKRARNGAKKCKMYFNFTYVS